MTTKLPYTTTTVFTYNGQPYADEASALRAAVEHTLGNAGITTTVMRECCALAPLLQRACDLGLGTQPAACEEKVE